ncbi:MAG: sulfatase [Myxococcales bacterium]|nr:sulfatase [Myxococcales bacterium]
MAAERVPGAAPSPARSWQLPRWWPSCSTLAASYLWGAAAVVLANAVAIAVAAPWPRGGLWVRLGHHAFDALAVLAGGVGLALPPWLCARLGRERSPAAHAALAALNVLGVWALLGPDLRNQASGLFDGRAEGVVYAGYVAGAGLLVSATQVAAGALARRRWLRPLPLAAGATVLVLAHLWARDDYPEVHAGALWAGAALIGSTLVVWPGWQPARLGRAVERAAAAPLLLALFVPPPNAVRLALFREPGSAPAFVIGRLAWPPPALAPAAHAGLHALAARSLAPRAREVRAAQPVVVLLTVDALRADVVAGDHDDVVPHLAALRASGAWFERAVAPGSQTSVSLTSLFTGRYFSELRWSEHGTGRSRFLYAADDPSPRFPELLGAAGVHTESFLGLSFLSGEYGIARGFATEHVYSTGRSHAFVHDVLEPLVAALRRVGPGPALFYAHVMEPHAPYDRGARREGSDFERYLSEVALVDSYVGRIRRTLAQRLPGRGHLIVTADHGEAFGEHGTFFHTKTLYEELVHVPLLVSGPEVRPGPRPERVGLVDLAPTLLELFGQPVPAELAGVSLLPAWRGQPLALRPPLAAEGRMRRAYWRGELKAVEDARRGTLEVYDLDADPGELDNLWDRDRARALPVVSALRAYFAVHAYAAPGYETPYKP